MAKRLTDTEKWKKALIRGLPGAYKLLWFYLCDDCNHAGIWDVDFEVAEVRIGEKLDPKKALQLLSTKVLVIDAGRKWFIPSFVEFQYKNLSAGDRATKSVVELLKKYNLIDAEFKLVATEEGATKPLTRPIDGCKDKDKDNNTLIDSFKLKKDSQKKEPKTQYAPEVKLTEAENQKLVDEHGFDLVNRAYNYLANYKIEKAYKTKSDYHTIVRWVIDAVKNKVNGNTTNKPNPLASFNRAAEKAAEAHRIISEGQGDGGDLFTQIYGQASR